MLQFGHVVWCSMTVDWFENNEGAMCDINGALFKGVSFGLVNV
jgi:hypothetical protein